MPRFRARAWNPTAASAGTGGAGTTTSRIPHVDLNAIASRLAALDLEPIAERLLASVDRVAGSRWDAAVLRAAALPGTVRPEKIAALTESMSRELAAVGAAS